VERHQKFLRWGIPSLVILQEMKTIGQESPTYTIGSSPLPQLFPDLDKFLN
jgi:hypothetical protein